MTNALEITHLSKTYSNGFQAINDISLTVKDGDFFALLGPNGAGKSTLINILTTLSKKTSGEVKIYGHDLDADRHAAKACIGLVPQEYNFNGYDQTLEVVVNQAGYYGIPVSIALPRAKKYLTELGLEKNFETPVMRLSGGMKRRVMIARALACQPRLLILDEPTAGVDIELRRSLWTFLKKINEEGTTIILTTHYLEEAENLCRHIAIINHGKIIENTRMSDLLKTLDKESFILYTKEPIDDVQHFPAQWEAKKIESHAFELTLHKPCNVNHVFEKLESHGIQITSMRNKTNRLEALFVDRLQQNELA